MHDTSAVSGVVTIDGEPVTRGYVVFVPPKGRRAIGEINADGRYALKTDGGIDGAVVGAHKVGVVAYEDMEQYRAYRYDVSAVHEKPPAIVPERYNDPYASGLSFDVQAGTKNQADFHLTTEEP